MTSAGSPYARFRRALGAGNLNIVRAAAAELPRVDLEDALQVVLLMAAQADEHFDRAAARWLGRLALERPAMTLDDLGLAVDGLEALRTEPDHGRRLIGVLCRRHRLRVPASLP